MKCGFEFPSRVESLRAERNKIYKSMRGLPRGKEFENRRQKIRDLTKEIDIKVEEMEDSDLNRAVREAKHFLQSTRDVSNPDHGWTRIVDKRGTELPDAFIIDATGRYDVLKTRRLLVQLLTALNEDWRESGESEDTLRIPFVHDIPLERVRDLLCCAFEGGTGYWCQVLDYVNPEGIETEFPYLDLPLSQKGEVLCWESRDEDLQGVDPHPVWRLNLAAVRKGLRLMATECPRHFADFLNENEDALTGDVFLQLALLGKLVYG